MRSLTASSLRPSAPRLAAIDEAVRRAENMATHSRRHRIRRSRDIAVARNHGPG